MDSHQTIMNHLIKHQNLKKKIMKYSILFFAIVRLVTLQQSENETKLEQQMEFTFNEYLGYVKFHPGKTANLEINKGKQD
jgi:hypothetical protein